jgi:D-amino-acid oxidase
VAKDLPPNTTSNKAAAVWFPYLAYPVDKIGKWASYTMEHLKKEVLDANSGVIVQKTVELYREEPPEPEWKVYIHYKMGVRKKYI